MADQIGVRFQLFGWLMRDAQQLSNNWNELSQRHAPARAWIKQFNDRLRGAAVQALCDTAITSIRSKATD
jgi:hypothetical protein